MNDKKTIGDKKIPWVHDSNIAINVINEWDQPQNKKPLIVFANRTDPKAVGGLTSLMNDHLATIEGVDVHFVGWSGNTVNSDEERLYHYQELNGIKYHTIDLTREEAEKGYEGFQNSYIWPVYHEKLDKAAKVEGSIEANDRINNLFADVAIKHAGLRPDTDVFVNDYQLIKLGQILAQKGHTGKRAFHNHIPFGSKETLMEAEAMGLNTYAEVKSEIVTPFQYYDSAGFQSPGDIKNFLSNVTDEPHDEAEFVMPYQHYNISGYNVTYNPVGINVERFRELAAGNKEADRVKQHIQEASEEGVLTVIVPARFEYTKNQLGLMQGYRKLQIEHPEIAAKVHLRFIGEDSRPNIPAYKTYQAALRAEIAASNLYSQEQGITPAEKNPVVIVGKMPREELAAINASATQIMEAGGRQAIFIGGHKDGMCLTGMEGLSADINNIVINSDGNGCSRVFNDNEGDDADVPQPHVPTLTKVRGSAAEAAEEMMHMLIEVYHRDMGLNRRGNEAALRNMMGKYNGDNWLPHIMTTFEANREDHLTGVNATGQQMKIKVYPN